MRAVAREPAHEILHIEDADDVVERALVDGDAGVTDLLDDPRDGAEFVVLFEGLDLGARRHHLLGGQVAELDDRLDHLLLLEVDLALALSLLDHAHQLGLQHFVAVVALHAREAFDHLVEETPQGAERGAQVVETAHQRRPGVDQPLARVPRGRHRQRDAEHPQQRRPGDHADDLVGVRDRHAGAGAQVDRLFDRRGDGHGDAQNRGNGHRPGVAGDVTEDRLDPGASRRDGS